MNKVFPERLREWRESKGLTQQQLAELIKCTDGAVSSYETGRTYPRGSIRDNLFNLLGDTFTAKELSQ